MQRSVFRPILLARPLAAWLSLAAAAGCGPAHGVDDADLGPADTAVADGALGDAQLDGGEDDGGLYDAGDDDAASVDQGGPTDLGGPDTAPDADVLDGAVTSDGGAVDAGPVEPPTPTYDYYHDGTDIRWVSEDGMGTLGPLPGAAPRAAVFQEGALDSDGWISDRRASVMFSAGGSLYRLTGRPAGAAWPAIEQVSSLSTVAALCSTWPISNLADRTQSLLYFSWVPVGQTCQGTPEAARQWSVVRLEDDALQPAIPARPQAVPCVSPEGELDDVLFFDSTYVRRIDTLHATGPGQALFASASVLNGLLAHALGGHRYMLQTFRGDGRSELYAYDAATHTASPPLGPFGDDVRFDASLADDTYAYFTANATYMGARGLYRLRLDGTAPRELLLGSVGAGWEFVGVAAGHLYVAQPGAELVRYPAATDFGAPPAAAPVLNGFVTAFSSTRILFSSGTQAQVAPLDGSSVSTFQVGQGETSRWLGCAADRAHVLSRRNRECERALLLTPSFGEGQLFSFDASSGGDGSGAFFTHPARDQVLVGAVATPYRTDARPMDSLAFFRARTSPVFAARVTTQLPSAVFRYGVLFTRSVVHPADVVFDVTSDSDVTWLSR